MINRKRDKTLNEISLHNYVYHNGKDLVLEDKIDYCTYDISILREIQLVVMSYNRTSIIIRYEGK